jgi:hypothetical protein
LEKIRTKNGNKKRPDSGFLQGFFDGLVRNSAKALFTLRDDGEKLAFAGSSIPAASTISSVSEIRL